jgi:hypothetical protein
MGGLGNQMFQYAFGKRLAFESRDSVRFDVDNGFRRDDRGRTLALSAFMTDVVAAAADVIPAGMNWGSPWHRVARAVWSAMPQSARRVVYETRQFQYDEACITRHTPAYYFGYWQHPRYLESIEAALRHDFTLRQPMSGPVQAVVEEMARCRSVSVHMRSYLDVGRDGRVITSAQTHHGACSPDYFRRAIDRIGAGDGTVCFVFGDNLEWAKAHVELPVACRYVADMVRCSDAEEMLLMAACRHHVISNSTFSWWGAWLGANPAKVVVAPRVWMRSLPEHAVDICPPNWVRV